MTEPWPDDPPNVAQPFNIGAYARMLGLPEDAQPREWGFYDRLAWIEGWVWQDRQPGVGPVVWQRV
jgi:hypothetical protein